MMDLSISHRPARQQKRVRSAFTTQQIELLEEQFKKNQYINGEHRKQLAFVLNIQERAVKIWFQNRRMKEKKDHVKVDGETNNNKGTQQRLNNVFAVPSANDQPSFQVITKPVVVRSDNMGTVCVRASVNMNDKSISVEPKAITTGLSNLPSVGVIDKSSDSAKPTKSNTVSSYFIQQHSSVPSLRKPTAPNTTNGNAISVPKNTSFLTEKLTAHYNSKMKEVENSTKKNLCSKVESLTNSSEPVSTVKSRKLSRSGVKIPKTANVQKPPYVPLMQTMYTPISPSSSIVWKPVNILSAPGSHVNTYGIPQVPQSQQKKCCCNCTQSHSSSHVYGPESVVKINNSPYHQYVISLPFQNHSSCL